MSGEKCAYPGCPKVVTASSSYAKRCSNCGAWYGGDHSGRRECPACKKWDTIKR